MTDTDIDPRFELRPDGLYRICIVCGRPFKIESAAAVLRETAGGKIAEVIFDPDHHPRNLLMLQCPGCPPADGQERPYPTPGHRDARARLRRDGLESSRDAGF